MSLTAWPIDEYASDAQVIRQQMGSLIGAAGGLVAAGGLELTQKGTPNMSVIIAGGTPAEGGLWIPGYTSTTGPTYFQNTATYEQVIEAAGASNPRVDTIVARIYDTSLDSSGKHEPVLQALRGAEESGVTLGNKKGAAAVPKNCYVLGYVLVPAKASSIVTADIENVAVTCGGLVRTATAGFMSWGMVSESGAIFVTGSGNWSVSKKSTGVYEVTLSGTKGSPNMVPFVIANESLSSARVATIIGTTTVSFKVLITNLSGTAANGAFFFMGMTSS